MDTVLPKHINTQIEQNAVDFLKIHNPESFCKLLNVKFKVIQEQINRPQYETYFKEKKRGGKRIIYAPSEELKTLQRKINYYLQAYYLCIKPDEVTGFVIHPKQQPQPSNIVQNALPHIGKKHVLNIDIKHFFDSITAKRVKSLLIGELFNFNDHISNVLTLLTTFEGKLPTGSPSSPVISNFIFYPIDKEIINFCKKHKLTYTRYADDLTFSSDEKIEVTILEELQSILAKNDFEINKKKIRFQGSNSRQTVTGLVVNQKVNIERKKLKSIRAILHDLKNNDLEIVAKKHYKLKGDVTYKQVQKMIDYLIGYIGFIGEVRGKDDVIYLRFKKELDTYFKN